MSKLYLNNNISSSSLVGGILKMKKKYLFILIGIILLLLGGTYAWYRKTIYNVNVAGITKNLEDYIVYSSGINVTGVTLTPTDDYTEGSSTTITFYKKDSPYDNIYGHIYIDINTMPVDLSKELRYTVVNNTTSEVVGEGLFYPYNVNDSVPVAYNIDLSSTATTYTVYIWIDEDLHDSNLDSTNLDIDIRCSATLVELDTQLYGGAKYISNLYTNANKTTHTDSKYSITYNYAESKNLMNDRLASMDVNADAGNIRYYGADPDNYVSFNNELWRIIGVFDGRLKLIKKDSIGNYSYDTSAYNVNRGYGINQWGPSTNSSDDSIYDGADLMKLLNPGYDENTDKKCLVGSTNTNSVWNCGDNDSDKFDDVLVNNSLYWNAQSGTCYNSGAYNTTTCDFSSNGLSNASSKAMIDEVTWHLGSNSKNEDPWDGNTTASRLYTFEHSDNSGIQCIIGGNYCTLDVVGTTTWIGKVGLMSPSDYAYATGGGITHGIGTCLSTHAAYVSDNSIQNWSNTYTDCKDNDWLLIIGTLQWTITARANSSDSFLAFGVNGAGYVNGYHTINAIAIRPVVFLKPNVTIIDGDGTSGDPYQLVM